MLLLRAAEFEEYDMKPTLFSDAELRTATRDFHKDMILGQGAYGAVYKVGHTPSIGGTYMPPPSYDDVKVNGTSQHASADGGPRTAKSLYLLRCLSRATATVQQFPCCVEGTILFWFVYCHIRSKHNTTVSGALYIGIGLAL